MIKHWQKLLNTDCVVLGIKERTVYPIFKVGSSSLTKASDKEYINQNISKCTHIDVLLRDPEDRFVSGLNEYCQLNNLDIHKTLESVRRGEVIDRHFAPQFVWLLHLYKYYKGNVTLRPFSDIKQFTNLHKWGNKEKIDVPHLQSFVEIDQKLMAHLKKTLPIGTIINELIDVLP